MNKQLVLAIKDLSIGYRKDKMVVDHVSLTVSEGDIVTIVGQSGSGKSTLIHAILGIMHPAAKIYGGSIRYADFDLHKMTPKLRQQVSGPEISMIFQNSESHMDPIKKIKSQYDEFINAHIELSAEARLALEVETFQQMGFKDPMRVLNSYPFELSGGMQQRVSLAMAIALKPKLILADEPTSALDVTLQRQIIGQIIDLSRSTNTAVLLVTHNMGVAAYMSDKIAVMNDGKIVELGERNQIINAPQNDYTKQLLAAVPELDEAQLESE